VVFADQSILPIKTIEIIYLLLKSHKSMLLTVTQGHLIDSQFLTIVR
jgi:hypothetical protein